MSTQILVAPAGSRFSVDSGSENGWVYDIVNGLAAIDSNLQFTCVSERTDDRSTSAIRVVDIGPRRSEELGGLMLPMRLLRAVRHREGTGGIRDVDLLHHALPFSVGRTFSLLARRAGRRGMPFVVGPLQTPLEWTGPDEQGGQLVTGPQPIRRYASAGATRVWPLIGRPLEWASAATLRRANRVVAIGPPAAELAESVGVDPLRISIIPPPVRSAIRPVPATRQRGGPLRVVTAGYLIERKAIDDIIAAVGKLAAEGCNIELDVAGDGPALQGLRRAAQRYPGAEIRFHGWMDQPALQDLVYSSHVYVSMSKAESWGQAVADALASALVVVTAENTGARSMTALGAPLTTVPVGDRERLVDQIRRLWRSDPAAVATRAADGARWAASTVTLPVVVNRWHQVYCEVIAQAGSDLSGQPATNES